MQPLAQPQAQDDDGSDKDRQPTLTWQDVGSDVPRPPVSPITPAVVFARLPSQKSRPLMPPPPLPSRPALLDHADQAQSLPTPLQDSQALSSEPSAAHAPSDQPLKYMTPPDFIDFDIDDNTDAMALRAAITILELQKEKCRRDFATLNQLKKSLKDDPDRFVQEFVAGSMRPLPRPDDDPNFDAIPYDEITEADSDEDGNGQRTEDQAKLPRIPPMQKIARCPPINWAKYHIVGAPLDRMHEEQLLRPTQGTPLTGPLLPPGDPAAGSLPNHYTASPAPEHHVFKAYDEFEDGQVRPRQPGHDSHHPVTAGVSTRRRSRK